MNANYNTINNSESIDYLKSSVDSLKKLKRLSNNLNNKNQQSTNKPSLINSQEFLLQNSNSLSYNELENNISSEEIKNQLGILKMSYENQIKNLNNIYKEINEKEETLNNLTIQISNHLQEENIKNNSKIDSKNLKEISELKLELNQLKRKHIKNLNQIEIESEEILQNNLQKINEEYNLRIKEFSENNDKNIKKLQDEIFTIKREMQFYDDKDKYMNRKQHEEIINEIKNDNSDELNLLEKEIEKLENIIKQNYSNLQTKNKNFMTEGESSNFFNLAEFQRELNTGNNNESGFIYVTSQLETPIETNTNKMTLNSNYKKNYEPFKNYIPIEILNETNSIEEVSTVYEEIPINQINTLTIDKEKCLIKFI